MCWYYSPKERFASRLLKSDTLSPCVTRSNGFFVDLEDFYSMAKSAELAEFFLTAMEQDMIAPCFGKNTLADHYIQLFNNSN